MVKSVELVWAVMKLMGDSKWVNDHHLLYFCREYIILHIELQGHLYTLQLCNNWHLSGVFPKWDSPSAKCYLTNLSIYLIVDDQVFSEAIYITSFNIIGWL